MVQIMTRMELGVYTYTQFREVPRRLEINKSYTAGLKEFRSPTGVEKITCTPIR